MPLTKLQFKPGINREGTNYSNEGGWFDGDKIRFKSGYVERIGGWERVAATEFLGSCRCMLDFVTLASDNLLFMGTHVKAYLEDGGQYSDITPYETIVNCATDPITTGTAGSGIITVNAVAHGAVVGGYVTLSGATDVDGILAADINKNFKVLTVPSTDSFTVDTGGSATAGSTSGGGASVVASIEIEIGLDTTILGNGWGAGTWGRFTWGSGAGSLAGQNLRLWFADSWGEDLVANIADGKIYYWDATDGKTTRMVELSDVAGATGVPTKARRVMVSDTDRHVLCFGATPIGSSVFDPLLIRWSSQESVTDWTPTATNTSGDLRLSQGSEIVTAIRTTRQFLVFTENSLHSVQFIGAPFTFGTALLGTNVRIAGPNCGIAVNDSVFWMGQDNFYVYDGRIQPIPCSVRQYVFDDMNRNQSFKFHSGSLSSNSEVWWFYCSANSDEIDRYVVYNYLEQVWYYGTLVRTAWNDRASGSRLYPQAPGPDSGGKNVLYNHEFGLDDGSFSPKQAINTYIQSADFDIGDGQQFMLVNRLLPDLNFGTSTATDPEVSFIMNARNYSGNEKGQRVRTTLGADPFLTTAANTRIRVSLPNNTLSVGDYVTITGATGFDGLTVGRLNQRFKVLSIPKLGITSLTTSTATPTSVRVTTSSASTSRVVGEFVEISGALGFDGVTAPQLNQRVQIISVIDSLNFVVTIPGITPTTGGISGGGTGMSFGFGTFFIDVGALPTTGGVSGGGSAVQIEFETSGQVVRTSVVSGVGNYTEQVFMRLRGRQVNLKVESSDLGVSWRLGAPRLDARPDGRR